MAEARAIPLAVIGLDLRPERQIRPLDWAHVQHLVDETDPAEWDPIEVRSWPESDPFPTGEMPLYQVISGYHRTSAARRLGLAMIRTIVVDDANDDASFTVRALRGNLRHGKGMTTEEKRDVVRRLRTLGMSESDIAKETGTPKGTVHNWLTGRNTNAGRAPVRTHQPSIDTTGDDDLDLPTEWQMVPGVTLDARQVQHVSSTISDFLAETPIGLIPGDVLTWAATLSPLTRRSMVDDIDQTLQWLGYLRTVLMSAERQGAA